MPQQSSKKLFFTFFLVFVFLNAFFWMASAKITQAQDDSGKACPCGPVESAGNRNIRLQIAIPGITDTCTYKVKTIQNGTEGDIEKQCHYVASNLPAFIQKAYSFSIGLIAIMAVIMIMIGGVKWILAAGNPGSIGDAQKTITAAVSGLVLALLSYAILNTINPNLTNLQMTQPSQIKTIQQSTNWCIATNLIHPKLDSSLQGAPEDFKQWSGECGIEYEIKDTSDENGNLKRCWGNGGCTGKTICYQYADGVRPFCYDIEATCKKQDDEENESGRVEGKNGIYYLSKRTSGCDLVDAVLIEQNSNYVCSKRNDVGSADECVLGEQIFCPDGYMRVPCELSNKCSIKNKEGATEAVDCSGTFASYTRHLCIDEPRRAAKGAVGICCKKKGVEEYKCEYENTIPPIDNCHYYDSVGGRFQCEAAPASYGIYDKGCVWN
ncbi:hypothetical protein COU23_00750, partial [Candidatus Kuenenbacteria bacterium CG10_big_fil_rev_8_21_14_0_10_36_11]